MCVEASQQHMLAWTWSKALITFLAATGIQNGFTIHMVERPPETGALTGPAAHITLLLSWRQYKSCCMHAAVACILEKLPSPLDSPGHYCFIKFQMMCRCRASGRCSPASPGPEQREFDLQ